MVAVGETSSRREETEHDASNIKYCSGYRASDRINTIDSTRYAPTTVAGATNMRMAHANV